MAGLSVPALRLLVAADPTGSMVAVRTTLESIPSLLGRQEIFETILAGAPSETQFHFRNHFGLTKVENLKPGVRAAIRRLSLACAAVVEGNVSLGDRIDQEALAAELGWDQARFERALLFCERVGALRRKFGIVLPGRLLCQP